MSPLWGCVVGSSAFLHRLLRSENPLGLYSFTTRVSRYISPWSLYETISYPENPWILKILIQTINIARYPIKCLIVIKLHLPWRRQGWWLNNSVKIRIFVKLGPRFKYGKGSRKIVVIDIQLEPYLLAIEEIPTKHITLPRRRNMSIVAIEPDVSAV